MSVTCSTQARQSDTASSDVTPSRSLQEASSLCGPVVLDIDDCENNLGGHTSIREGALALSENDRFDSTRAQIARQIVAFALGPFFFSCFMRPRGSRFSGFTGAMCPLIFRQAHASSARCGRLLPCYQQGFKRQCILQTPCCARFLSR